MPKPSSLIIFVLFTTDQTRSPLTDVLDFTPLITFSIEYSSFFVLVVNGPNYLSKIMVPGRLFITIFLYGPSIIFFSMRIKTSFVYTSKYVLVPLIVLSTPHLSRMFLDAIVLDHPHLIGAEMLLRSPLSQTIQAFLSSLLFIEEIGMIAGHYFIHWVNVISSLPVINYMRIKSMTPLIVKMFCDIFLYKIISAKKKQQYPSKTIAHVLSSNMRLDGLISIVGLFYAMIPWSVPFVVFIILLLLIY